MKISSTSLKIIAVVFSAGLLSSGGVLRGGDLNGTNHFYVAHRDPRPGWPHSPAAIAAMVKELGYDGMGVLGLGELSEYSRAFDSVGLRVSQIYLDVDLSLGHIPEVSFDGKPFDPRLKQQLPLLKGRGAQLVLCFYGLKASDRVRYNVHYSEPVIHARALKVIHEIAELAGADTEVLLSNADRYPPEITVDFMLGLANEVNRPNVGIILNLFDYLAASSNHDYRSLLARAIPRLKAVAVVGTDQFPVPTGGYYLKPLGQGSFDIRAFLKTLNELGYKGSVVLETQCIAGDRREVLQKSMEAWRKMRRSLEPKP